MSLFRRKPKWKAIAERALREVRALDAARYPIALKIELGGESPPERLPGESLGAAFARSMNLSIEQAAEFCRGMFEHGIPFDATTDEKTLLDRFRGLAAVLILLEKDLQACPAGRDLAPAQPKP